MKITLEFNSLSDMLKELPRLSHVIETPPDSSDFEEIATADEAERDRKFRVGTAKPDAPVEESEEPADDTPAEKPAQKKQARAGATAKAKAEKNKPAEENASDVPWKVSVEEVRAALSALIKSGRRDAATLILKHFNAANLPALKEEDYAEALNLAKAAKELSYEDLAKEIGDD